jgi:excisionase family DNA binding protein
MRGLGEFQVAQMKKGDPRIPQMFRALRQALDLLEEMSAHPHQEVKPEPSVALDKKPTVVLKSAPAKMAYSVKEVRALTGISNTKIYSDIKDGRLRPSKNGGRTLILAKDLQEWINGWQQ